MGILKNCIFSYNIIMKGYSVVDLNEDGEIFNISFYENQMSYFTEYYCELNSNEGKLYLSDSTLVSGSICCVICISHSSTIRDSIFSFTENALATSIQFTIIESSLQDSTLVASSNVMIANSSFSNSTLSISSADVQIVSCIIQNTTLNSTDSQLQIESSSIDAQSVINLTRSSLQLDGDWIYYPASFLCQNSTVYSSTNQSLPYCPVQISPFLIDVIGSTTIDIPFYSPVFFQFTLTNVSQLDLIINSNRSLLILNNTFNIDIDSEATLLFSWNGQNGSYQIAEFDTFNLSLVSSAPFGRSGSTLSVKSIGETVYLPNCVVETRTKQLSGQGKLYGTLYFYNQWNNPIASLVAWNISSDTGFEMIQPNQYSYVFSFEPLESNLLITYQSIYLNGTKMIEIESKTYILPLFTILTSRS